MDEYLKTSWFVRAIFMVRTFVRYHLSFKKKFARMTAIPTCGAYGTSRSSGPTSDRPERGYYRAESARTRLTTVKLGGYEGAIEIGDNVLVMAGVRVSSASKIEIGDDCMLANYCYLTDADWHGIHDRTQIVGSTKPIVLEKGVWIGDSAIVCKGVRIGRNSIVGADRSSEKTFPRTWWWP